MAGSPPQLEGKEKNSMQTVKDVASKVRARRVGIISAAAIAASFGMLALGGCSSENADKPPETPMAVDFQPENCPQLETNPYQGPTGDQPRVTPELIPAHVHSYRNGPQVT